ncbi:MAG: TRAP transporter permease [Vicinamibacteria bacterium]
MALPLLGLVWVVTVLPAQPYRAAFLGVALALAFVMYPARPGRLEAPSALDWSLAAASAAVAAWPILDRARFAYRAATPGATDLALGALAVALVLEATRRSVGWALPLTALGFLGYAWLGPYLDRVGLGLVAHRGYGLDRIVGTLYLSLDGLFGVPLDVAATYIVLFAVYGAVLERSGAGHFFIDWSLAALGRSGSPAAPGRTATLAGFLLGSVSGSGVATTVTLGSVAWPLLRRAGYSAEAGGAVLAAAGIGAILSPPTLGAAAFLIAEFLRISYLQVLVMAAAPTLLYYLSVFLMIEADARRLVAPGGPPPAVAPLGRLTWQRGHHFLSLLAIVALMAAGFSAFRAVVLATLVELASAALRGSGALRPRALVEALASAGRGVVAVAVTTATAGIVVGVTALTGLGLKAAGLLVSLAGGSLTLGVLFSAVAVLALGLAVPVTASYVIAAVMIAPALEQVGVSRLAAHMFIFYYAVLSEVSPPTALAPVAAAALTGGRPVATMLLTWKYTLPAFLVPLAFTLSPAGAGLLLQGTWGGALLALGTAALGIAALAHGLGGGLWRPATRAERVLAGLGGLLLVAGDPRADAAGVGLLCAAFALGRAGGAHGPLTESTHV